MTTSTRTRWTIRVCDSVILDPRFIWWPFRRWIEKHWKIKKKKNCVWRSRRHKNEWFSWSRPNSKAMTMMDGRARRWRRRRSHENKNKTNFILRKSFDKNSTLQHTPQNSFFHFGSRRWFFFLFAFLFVFSASILFTFYYIFCAGSGLTCAW